MKTVGCKQTGVEGIVLTRYFCRLCCLHANTALATLLKLQLSLNFKDWKKRES